MAKRAIRKISKEFPKMKIDPEAAEKLARGGVAFELRYRDSVLKKAEAIKTAASLGSAPAAADAPADKNERPAGSRECKSKNKD